MIVDEELTKMVLEETKEASKLEETKIISDNGLQFK